MRHAGLDIATAVAFAIFGVWEAIDRSRVVEAVDRYGNPTDVSYPYLGARLIIVAFMVGAVGTFRLRPGISLGLLWAACAVQLLAPVDVMFVQFAFVLVLFGCARWGRVETALAALASVPVALVAGVYVVYYRDSAIGYRAYSLLPGIDGRPSYLLAIPAVLMLMAPWVAGISLRLVENARVSRVREQEAVELRQVAEQQRGQAEDVARLKADQARIARDVHDVVGHSLAVILAQAEAATLLPDEELPRIRAAMAAIAASARESLTDVGAVLGGGSVGPTTGRFPQLISQTATTAPSVVTVTRGTPRTLAPDLDVVAERVLREMITNAIKHGAEASSIDLVVYWGQALEISVTNTVGERSVPGSGQGLDGMRSRLQAVGGSLVVDTYEGTFRVVARIPLPVV
ncbi:hypothetical protein GCM10022215_26440 [Nocardioides fonticola]|uniref:histidine kinase n=1 Tax=Nocardioides fonticola TaxID=450363 RepID=A0ABP7XMM1_9ACTN